MCCAMNRRNTGPPGAARAETVSAALLLTLPQPAGFAKPFLIEHCMSDPDIPGTECVYRSIARYIGGVDNVDSLAATRGTPPPETGGARASDQGRLRPSCRSKGAQVFPCRACPPTASILGLPHGRGCWAKDPPMAPAAQQEAHARNASIDVAKTRF